jgi:hypothetical protein
MASADTIATVSKAFFRDVPICKTFGKFPSWTLRRHSNRAHAMNRLGTRLAAYYGRTLIVGNNHTK